MVFELLKNRKTTNLRSHNLTYYIRNKENFIANEDLKLKALLLSVFICSIINILSFFIVQINFYYMMLLILLILLTLPIALLYLPNLHSLALELIKDQFPDIINSKDQHKTYFILISQELLINCLRVTFESKSTFNEVLMKISEFAIIYYLINIIKMETYNNLNKIMPYFVVFYLVLVHCFNLKDYGLLIFITIYFISHKKLKITSNNSYILTDKSRELTYIYQKLKMKEEEIIRLRSILSFFLFNNHKDIMKVKHIDEPKVSSLIDFIDKSSSCDESFIYSFNIQSLKTSNSINEYFTKFILYITFIMKKSSSNSIQYKEIISKTTTLVQVLTYVIEEKARDLIRSDSEFQESKDLGIFKILNSKESGKLL